MQVEITSECDLNCIMCPKSYYKDRWKSGHMDMDTFIKVSQSFSHTNYIHLQGWGEPLVHKNLFEMIEKVKNSGVSVGITTNGMGLNQKNCEKIVDLGVDIVGISVDGATKETYESIRLGASFKTLLDNVKTLVSAKKKSSINKPKLVFSVVKMKKNIDEIPSLVDLAHKLDIDRVVCANLDCVSKPLDEELRVFSKQENKEYQSILRKAEAKAEKYGIEYYSYPLTPQEVPVCPARPLDGFYISWDGFVSPCVYLNLPVDPIHRIYWGKEYEIERTCFGNILEDDLMNIWNYEGYRNFRDQFKQREETCSHRSPLDLTRLMDFFDIWGNKRQTEMETEVSLSKTPPPTVCQTCYKRHGI